MIRLIQEQYYSNCEMKMAVLDSVPIISLKNTKWFYRGEGNANLVIAIPQEKVILRLEKCTYDSKKTNESLLECKLQMNVLFCEKIIVSFLGKDFIQPPRLARISSEEIGFLDKELLSQRPSYRLNKGVRNETVSVHPDYTFLPPLLCNKYQNGHPSNLSETVNSTYCIEIKPKQGWIFPSDRKHPKCAYCLNQYLKIKKKRIFNVSPYCPLDLFSGNLPRMKKAIKDLLFNPQNNLKIFQDGKLVYSEESKGSYFTTLKEWMGLQENGKAIPNEVVLEKWCSLISKALTKAMNDEPFYNIATSEKPELNSGDISLSPLHGKIKPCDFSKSPLPSNCILNRILMIQKLQDVPFSKLYDMYKQRKESEGDYGYVNKLIYSEEAMDSIGKYLLASTAKDCSIFLTFQQTNLKDPRTLNYIQDCDDKIYSINIGISDIDPKPLSCIEKHFKRDQDVVSTILKYIGENV